MLDFSVGKPKTTISSKDEKLLSSTSAIAERKWDGSRMIGVIGSSGIEFYSRALSTVTKDFLPYTQKFPHLIKELEELGIPSSTILDGEIVMLDVEDPTVEDFDSIKGILNSKDDRAVSLQEKRKAHWMLFDVLQVGGQDLKSRTYRERRKWLESLITNHPKVNHLHCVEQIGFTSIDDLEHQLTVLNWEGFVIKLLDGQYEIHKDKSKVKRTSTWWKIRLDKNIDLIVTGYDLGQGRFKEVVGSLRCGIMDGENRYLHVCNAGGMKEEERQDMLGLTYPRVAEIKYTQKIKSKEGKVKYIDSEKERIIDRAPFSLRFPSFTRWHLDKTPDECVL